LAAGLVSFTRVDRKKGKKKKGREKKGVGEDLNESGAQPTTT